MRGRRPTSKALPAPTTGAAGSSSGTPGELRAFRRLADMVGAEGALLLSAWWGGRLLAVPVRPDPRHVLARLIGVEALAGLCAAHGGQTLHIPRLALDAVRHAGQVHRLSAHGLSAGAAAEFVGLTERQVLRIQSHLRADTPRLFGLDATADEGARAAAEAPPPAPAPPAQGLDALAQLRAARRMHDSRARDYVD